jgi:hypothetical protein
MVDADIDASYSLWIYVLGIIPCLLHTLLPEGRNIIRLMHDLKDHLYPNPVVFCDQYPWTAGLFLRATYSYICRYAAGLGLLRTGQSGKIINLAFVIIT